MPLYIKDANCISPQQTIGGQFFLLPPMIHSGSQYWAVEPEYAGVIPNGLLRRMGKSVRMATGAAMPLLNRWQVDGIIIGTTDGGMEDCHRFLNQVIAYNEGTLTPTGFVQGSPSAVAGGLALMAGNSGYNNTHANKGLSFENCLLDAWMLLKEGEAGKLLVGNVEEISPAQYRIETLAGFIKKEETTSENVLASQTRGAVNGEGAVMFVISADATDALAAITDVDMVSNATVEELEALVSDFLGRNGLAPADVDTVLLGYSGDATSDHWYDAIAGLFPSETGRISYKNLFGESPSASAFAAWYANGLLQGNAPLGLSVLSPAQRDVRKVLIYNHFQGRQHGLMLMERTQGVS